MSREPEAYLGLDIGEQLALSGALDAPAGGLESPSGSWPLRARVGGLEAAAGTGHEADEPATGLHRRGLSPDQTLVVSLGATSLEQACSAADRLCARGVIVPALACALWSEGVTPANVIREYGRELPPQPPDFELLRDLFAELMEAAAQGVQALELDQDDSLLDRYLDLRYSGHHRAIVVPVASLVDMERLLRPFHEAHQARVGWSEPRRAVELTAVRARCLVSTLFPVQRSVLAVRGRDLSTPTGWEERVLPAGHRLYERR